MKVHFMLFFFQSPVPQIVGTLNAAQTQYLSQLTQQTSENSKAAQYGSNVASQQPPGQYNTAAAQPYVSQGSIPQYASSPVITTYAASNVANSIYVSSSNGVSSAQNQPARKTQRARVPPPSKVGFFNFW